MSVRTDFAATRYLVDAGAFSEDPFTLIDVGCRGGIHQRWRAFENYLKAYAIDPSPNEIRRLREDETNPNVSYSVGYIGLPSAHPVVAARAGKGPWGNNPWSRLSAAWAVEVQTRSGRNHVANGTFDESSRRIGLSEFVNTEQVESVDFVKVDVDGEDLYVLLSGSDVIQDQQVLGLELEVNFFGTACDTDNTFHNIDRLMRAHGYELFDLIIKRYSRRAMPAPFVYHLFAETQSGAPVQADAFYARDVVGCADRSPSFSMSNAKLLKMAAVHELFGLPDCAAEILIAFKNRLCEVVDVAYLLDLLTPPLNGRTMTHQKYCGIFAKNPTDFYPQAEVPQPHPADVFSLRDKLKRSLKLLSNFDRALF